MRSEPDGVTRPRSPIQPSLTLTGPLRGLSPSALTSPALFPTHPDTSHPSLAPLGWAFPKDVLPSLPCWGSAQGPVPPLKSRQRITAVE